jgi:hypothetical protein
MNLDRLAVNTAESSSCRPSKYQLGKKICFLPELLSSSVPLLWFISYSELLNKELQVGNLCSAATTTDHNVGLVHKELFTRLKSITNEGWWRRLNQVLPYENLQTKYCIIFGARTRAPSMEFATRTWNINISTTEIILYISFSDLRNPKKLDLHAQTYELLPENFPHHQDFG